MDFTEPDLLPEFRARLYDLLTGCRARGVEMRPYVGLRTPLEQARLWRQSRTREEIEQTIGRLERSGAPFLAHCIELAGPQSGPPVTNAIPGLSWHQWGEAVDSVWIVDGAAEWSTRRQVNGLNGYAVYAQEARARGLDAGGLWKRLKDWPHVQLRQAGSPAQAMELAEIDRVMRERFEGGHSG